MIFFNLILIGFIKTNIWDNLFSNEEDNNS